MVLIHWPVSNFVMVQRSIMFLLFFNVFSVLLFFPLLICYLCKTRCFLFLIYCMCSFFSCLFIFFILLHFFLFISFYFIFSHFFSVPKPSWSNTLLIWCLEFFWWSIYIYIYTWLIIHGYPHYYDIITMRFWLSGGCPPMTYQSWKNNLHDLQMLTNGDKSHHIPIY